MKVNIEIKVDCIENVSEIVGAMEELDDRHPNVITQIDIEVSSK